MAVRHSFADMSKFTSQFYYSTAVKLLHCSITDTGTPLQPRSEKVIISSIAAYQSSYTKCSLNCSRGGWDHVMLQVELKQFRIDQFVGLPELDAVG